MKLRPGTKYCLCAKCGEYFTNEKNFAMHRAGPMTNRRCVPPDKLTTKTGRAKLRKNSLGYWTRAEPAYLGGRDD